MRKVRYIIFTLVFFLIILFMKNSKAKAYNLPTFSNVNLGQNIDDVGYTDVVKSRGEFYMIHRAERIVDILYLMRKYKLEPKKIRFIQSKVNKDPNLLLIKGVKDAGNQLKIERPLVVYNEDGSYTNEILEIYHKK